MIIAATPASPTAAVVSRTPAFGFDGAQLGQTFADWRASSAAHAQMQCAHRSGDTAVIECLADPVPLGGGYLARNLIYRFQGDKLTNISFTTSVNAFEYSTALLKHKFGDPSGIKRDVTKLKDGYVFPHILMSWRNGDSTAQISDPVPPGGVLAVAMGLDDQTANPKRSR